MKYFTEKYWCEIQNVNYRLLCAQRKGVGHSTPTVTLNVYAHLMKPVNQEAACRLENMVFETNGDHKKKEVMA